LADRFPLAAAAILALPIKSCVVDAEAIVCDDSGMAGFDLTAVMVATAAPSSAHSTCLR
jgi:ATP-dependent DNA ligase